MELNLFLWLCLSDFPAPLKLAGEVTYWIWAYGTWDPQQHFEESSIVKRGAQGDTNSGYVRQRKFVVWWAGYPSLEQGEAVEEHARIKRRHHKFLCQPDEGKASLGEPQGDGGCTVLLSPDRFGGSSQEADKSENKRQQMLYKRIQSSL